jgi:chloramphenicol-sensitive protein RarD
LSESRRGFLLGVAAYAMWGAFPLYWPLLEPAGSLEILAHRIVWSLVTMGVLVVALGRSAAFRRVVADRRAAGLLTLAAGVITVNWATYIWGVNNGHVVALVLAFSFGSYGLCKKQAAVPAIESVTFETMVIGPIALGYLVWLGAHGDSAFTGHGGGHALLFMTTGIVTAIPLICFGGAAIRVPMVTLGLLQYLAPILQFGLGVLYFHEDMPAGRWIGFVLVWVALAVFTVESIRHRRRSLRLTAEVARV